MQLAVGKQQGSTKSSTAYWLIRSAGAPLTAFCTSGNFFLHVRFFEDIVSENTLLDQRTIGEWPHLTNVASPSGEDMPKIVIPNLSGKVAIIIGAKYVCLYSPSHPGSHVHHRSIDFTVHPAESAGMLHTNLHSTAQRSTSAPVQQPRPTMPLRRCATHPAGIHLTPSHLLWIWEILKISACVLRSSSRTV
jgi:hypothetical protein